MQEKNVLNHKKKNNEHGEGPGQRRRAGFQTLSACRLLPCLASPAASTKARRGVAATLRAGPAAAETRVR